MHAATPVLAVLLSLGCLSASGCVSESTTEVAPAPSEIAGSSSVQPKEETLGKASFLGEWFSCDRHLVFRSDGTWREEDMIARCGFDGTWRMEKGDLLRNLDETDCRFEGDQSLLETPVGPMPPAMAAVERGPDRLFLVDRDVIRTRLYFGPEVRRETWRFLGSTEKEPSREREMLLRVVGEPENGFFLGSFWSPKRDCGAFFSCGGRINTWHADGKRLSATASSGGECAISGTLDGTMQADGAYSGTFTSITCGRVERGTFRGVRVEEEAP